MEQGQMEESLKVASQITHENKKSKAYSEISMILMDQGKKEESLRVVENISIGDLLLQTFYDFGKTLSFKESHNLQSTITSEKSKMSLIEGVSMAINSQLELSENVNPYLFNFSVYTQYLPNILFHLSKIACFFEKNHNQKKLNILSEVLDIEEWRRISA